MHRQPYIDLHHWTERRFMATTGPPSLYTPAQRARRDATVWTPVQGVLAPVQFLIFLLSLGLVLYSLRTGLAQDWALASVVLKTLVLYLIMITGCIWEKVVFGQYLFAPALQARHAQLAQVLGGIDRVGRIRGQGQPELGFGGPQAL